MKIEIKYDGEKLVLSDEELDNPNFVEIMFYSDDNKDEMNENGFGEVFMAPIDELYSAVLAFKQLKNERKED